MIPAKRSESNTCSSVFECPRASENLRFCRSQRTHIDSLRRESSRCPFAASSAKLLHRDISIGERLVRDQAALLPLRRLPTMPAMRRLLGSTRCLWCAIPRQRLLGADWGCRAISSAAKGSSSRGRNRGPALRDGHWTLKSMCCGPWHSVPDLLETLIDAKWPPNVNAILLCDSPSTWHNRSALDLDAISR